MHTRITTDLENQIREEASSLGISVSNLVRNILTNTFDLVENIVSDSAEITRSARKRSTPAKVDKPSRPGAAAAFGQTRVLGWQEAILNLNAVCDHCNEILKKGSRAAIGIVENSGPSPFICLTCLKEIAHENDHDTNGNNR